MKKQGLVRKQVLEKRLCTSSRPLKCCLWPLSLMWCHRDVEERSMSGTRGLQRKLETNFVHQVCGGIWKHPFSLSLAPREPVLISSGLEDREFSICLAPKSTTC